MPRHRFAPSGTGSHTPPFPFTLHDVPACNPTESNPFRKNFYYPCNNVHWAGRLSFLIQVHKNTAHMILPISTTIFRTIPADCTTLMEWSSGPWNTMFQVLLVSWGVCDGNEVFIRMAARFILYAVYGYDIFLHTECLRCLAWNYSEFV